MKTVTKIVTPIITVLSLGLVFTTTNAPTQAATWHNGTPKIMRGVWKGPDGYKTRLAVKQGLYFGVKAGSEKTKYKYLGNHRYLIKFTSTPSRTLKYKITKHKLYDYKMKALYTR